MAELNDFIGLIDIAEKATNRTITLPTVQRGFVWKPYQIENLWDSLLRGYPVGAFVLSKKNNSEKEEYELLDGQQRASAICLGFYNPLSESANANHEIFKTSNENIMVFIDLLKPNRENDNREYLFRVITKSHPWGYSRKENQKILEAQHRNEAMGFYKIEDDNYYETQLKKFWPFDSYKPIPIGLFINASINKLSLTDLKNSIEKWKNELNINTKGELNVIRNGENIEEYSIQDIYYAVEKMLDVQKIPLLHLPELFNDATNTNSINPKTKRSNTKDIDKEEDSKSNVESKNATEQRNSEDRNIDEIENLFIRLNSGGTPLRGEELNYSILKSHITLDLQKDIEEKCKGLFYPARFITIAFRLFNNSPSHNSENERDSLSMNIKPKQFQRIMRESKKDNKKKNNFISFLEKFLASNIISETKKILIYSKENKMGLSSFIAHALADKAPEIMFMLLHRFYNMNDLVTEDSKPTVFTEELKKRVLGMVTLFTWLGKGDKQRDHSKLLENIWPCVKDFDTNRFWSEETVQRAMIKDRDFDILTPFPDFNKLKRIIPKNATIKSLTWAKFYNDNDYGKFIDKMFYNKDLILYAQREALHCWFSKIEEYNLEDTNRPFDWDHICPHNYISGKKNIAQALKDWYSSNGNLRAWPYSLNRGDQKDAPFIKLNPPKEHLAWWSKHLKKEYSTEIQLRNVLLEKSACDNKNSKWLELGSDTECKRVYDKYPFFTKIG